METIVGIILLLEVIMLIQIMFMKKQILRKIEVQQNNIEKILEVMERKSPQNTESEQELLQNNLVCNIEETKDLCTKRQEESPEELLNQVLSEVFS